MIFRAASYVAIAGIIISAAVFLNRDGAREDVPLSGDPMQSQDCGPHQHGFLDPRCEGNPEAEIKQAMADRQDYSNTHTDLGKGFYARGRYDVARSCYERALELDETSHEARYGLALTHIRLGDLAAARRELQRAVEANRKFVPAYISLAVLDYADGDYGMAKERLQGALRIEPSNRYAKKLLDSLPRVQRYAGSR